MRRLSKTPHAMTSFEVARFVCQVPPIAIDIPNTFSYRIWITLSILISLNSTGNYCREFLVSKSFLPKASVKLSLIKRGPKFYYVNISWNISSGKQFCGATKSFPFIFFLFFFFLSSLCFLLFFFSLNFFLLAPLQDLEHAFWQTPFYYHAILFWSA